MLPGPNLGKQAPWASLVHFGRVTLAHGAVTRSPELISRSKAKGLGQVINMLQLNGWLLPNEPFGSWHSGSNREPACGWWRRLSGVVLGTDNQSCSTTKSGAVTCQLIPRIVAASIRVASDRRQTTAISLHVIHVL